MTMTSTQSNKSSEPRDKKPTNQPASRTGTI